jgi:hypothetical protein
MRLIALMSLFCALVATTAYAIPEARLPFAIKPSGKVSQTMFNEASTALTKYIQSQYTPAFLKNSGLREVLLQNAIPINDQSEAWGLTVGASIQLSLNKTYVLYEQLVKKYNLNAGDASPAQPACPTQDTQQCSQMAAQMEEYNRSLLGTVSPSDNTATQDYANGTKEFLVHTFDHELFHVIDLKKLKLYDWRSPMYAYSVKWLALNPKDFSYQSGGGPEWIAQNRSEKTMLRPGFVSVYAMASELEDRADTYLWFMKDPQRFMQNFGHDKVVMAKLGIINELLQIVCKNEGPDCLPKPFQILPSLK